MASRQRSASFVARLKASRSERADWLAWRRRFLNESLDRLAVYLDALKNGRND